jgi:hypothetical protein
MKTQHEKNLETVRINGLVLEDIKKQTPEIALAAVSQNGWALQYVNVQTAEIAFAAVSDDGEALQYVKNQTPEIANTAVSQNGLALEYVKDQTREIVLAAISQNGYAIQYAHERSKEVILAAWNKVGNGLINFSARHNNTDVIKVLIGMDVPVDHVSERYPLTAFQIAANYCKTDAMLLLHNHGADIHLKNGKGNRNALSDLVANFHGSDDMDVALVAISTLLEIGVSTSERDNRGKTAIMLAEDMPIVLALIKAFELKKLISSTILKSKQSATRTRKVF